MYVQTVYTLTFLYLCTTELSKTLLQGYMFVMYSVTAAVFHIPVLTCTYLALTSEIHRQSFVCAKILTGIQMYTHFLSQIPINGNGKTKW